MPGDYIALYEKSATVYSVLTRSPSGPPLSLSLSALSLSAPSSVDEELLTEGDGQPVGHPYIHHKKLLSWIRHRKKPLQTSGSNLLESKCSEVESLIHECFLF